MDKKKTKPRPKMAKLKYQIPVLFSISNGLKTKINKVAPMAIKKSQKTLLKVCFGLGKGEYKILGTFILHESKGK